MFDLVRHKYVELEMIPNSNAELNESTVPVSVINDENMDKSATNSNKLKQPTKDEIKVSEGKLCLVNQDAGLLSSDNDMKQTIESVNIVPSRPTENSKSKDTVEFYKDSHQRNGKQKVSGENMDFKIGLFSAFFVCVENGLLIKQTSFLLFFIWNNVWNLFTRNVKQKERLKLSTSKEKKNTTIRKKQTKRKTTPEKICAEQNHLQNTNNIKKQANKKIFKNFLKDYSALITYKQKTTEFSFRCFATKANACHLQLKERKRHSIGWQKPFFLCVFLFEFVLSIIFVVIRFFFIFFVIFERFFSDRQHI
ncbi:hypothetical protein RFI_40260 [Reticulomyxa filosa]|uniref:Uncharacterized protein n=1 Tax=Reticulomyxa filosa TaxID=46433 RepID=X6L8A7_RETFI|nr:hypothetical protein RFI_40260 [Reticulomyxa filosa]|eukprot:ETN97271.1 hypothetical protein RFI_40260 [Reticulomyxa filosa]